jgi:hypothetical protein
VKTPEQIREVFLATLAKLPKHVDPARVTAFDGVPSRLRIYVDGSFLNEWAHGVCGWVPVESSAFSSGRAGSAVYRAARAAMKMHP